ncbi:isocitrate lyase/phosphoenolpyruvate mutase family protein [soil metagenome]
MSTIDVFSELHRDGIFVMPNPWDRGSALILEKMGFPALATTSAGLGRSLGKDDQQVTRDELITHVADLTQVLSVPLNVDSECLYPEDPGGIAETVRMLVDAGAAGCSIEDYNPGDSSIAGVSASTRAVEEAARACAGTGIVLTARAENHLYGVEDLNDTIKRLIAYREAGADVVYAPGLVTAEDIQRVVSETRAPVNVLAHPFGPTIEELGALGVRRVSTGSALFNAARRTLRAAAGELLEYGTSNYAV